MGKTVTFEISPDGGEIKSDAEGFAGGNCHKVVDPILQHLGKVTGSEDKPGIPNKSGVHVG